MAVRHRRLSGEPTSPTRDTKTSPGRGDQSLKAALTQAVGGGAVPVSVVGSLQRAIGNRGTARLVEATAPRSDRARAIQRYQLTKVAYMGTEVASQTVAFRAASGQGLKNLATIKVQGMNPVTASSVPPGKKGVTPKHSEQVVWESVKGAVEGQGKKIEWLYTEREPCGVAPGQRNCAAFVADLMKKHGVAGDNTPVYYSFEYPDMDVVRAAAKFCFDQGVVDNAQDAFDAAYDLWLAEHNDTKAALAAAQQQFSTPGPWGASAFAK